MAKKDKDEAKAEGAEAAGICAVCRDETDAKACEGCATVVCPECALRAGKDPVGHVFQDHKHKAAA